MAQQYVFVGSHQVTVDLSPTETIEEQEVQASTVKNGVYFVARFDPTTYANPSEVASILNALAGRFDSWMAVDGVVAIASVENVNAANMLQLGTQITVESTSGKSTTVFDYTYPVAEFNTSPAFIDAVNRQRAILDAVEGA